LALPAVARRARLGAALGAALPEQSAPGRAHLEALDRLLTARDGARLSLPGHLEARREAGQLRIGRPPPATPGFRPDVDIPLPGELTIAGWRITATLHSTATDAPAPGPWLAVLDAAAASGLTAGARRPGDRIALAGMVGRKRVQDLLVDGRVPRQERERRPVFRTRRGVAWVVGFRPAGWAVAADGPVVALRVQSDGEEGAASVSSGERARTVTS
jgi:tRNA(Ile)-lysidine synthase